MVKISFYSWWHGYKKFLVWINLLTRFIFLDARALRS
jgi:hypothetical protein